MRITLRELRRIIVREATVEPKERQRVRWAKCRPAVRTAATELARVFPGDDWQFEVVEATPTSVYLRITASRAVEYPFADVIKTLRDLGWHDDGDDSDGELDRGDLRVTLHSGLRPRVVMLNVAFVW